ncbi:c-type cytochrome [Georhizobium sp. MAB10]|uniref:c-type cytochrome n=1 Tax=Georhizobium sp. MAB10 TaxID=3028319 RepID=UPI003855BF39
MKSRLAIAAALLSISAALIHPASSQDGVPQEVRQDLMDEVGDATGVMGNMVRGRTDYDPAAVAAALQTISENTAVFADYFPEGSETGYETEALPAIWENKADFERLSQEMSTKAAELAAAVPADLASFQPVFQDFTRGCGACHEDYRQSDD